MPSGKAHRAYEASGLPLQSSYLNLQSGVKVPALLVSGSGPPTVGRSSIKRGRGALAGPAGETYNLNEPDRAMNLPIASAAIGLVRLRSVVIDGMLSSMPQRDDP